MITLRTADAPNGRIIFQIDDNTDPLFSADIALAVELFTNSDIRELVQRAHHMTPHVHMSVRMEHGLPMEHYMSHRNPFVTMYRSEIADNHILVIYTILQN